MTHPPTEPHPSRQVERIREILVGRQMESIERRLHQLETRVTPLPTLPSPQEDSVFMLCLEVFEKRHQQEIQEIRDEIDATRARHVQETHRLAQQIQAVARTRSEAGLAAQQELEHRVGQWLHQWQDGFTRHAREREDWLIREFRAELQRLRLWIQGELDARPPSPTATPALQDALHRLTLAANDLLAAFTPNPSSPPPHTPQS